MLCEATRFAAGPFSVSCSASLSFRSFSSFSFSLSRLARALSAFLSSFSCFLCRICRSFSSCLSRFSRFRCAISARSLACRSCLVSSCAISGRSVLAACQQSSLASSSREVKVPEVEAWMAEPFDRAPSSAVRRDAGFDGALLSSSRSAAGLDRAPPSLASPGVTEL
jgi:hypothetical protein